jgi:hypothetical protein
MTTDDRHSVYREREKAFLRVLESIGDGTIDNEKAMSEVARLILKIGSETEDNLNCVKHLDVGKWSESGFPQRTWTGVRLADRGILVSDVLSFLEGMPVPAGFHYELTQAEWDACIRFLIQVLSCFERCEPAPDEAEG